MKPIFLLLCAVTLFTATARAAIVTVTWRGYVSSGTDTGVFGTGDLTGERFTFVSTIDDSVATPFKYSFPGTGAFIYGGSVEGSPSPASGVLTIGGVAHAPLGDYFGQEYNEINYSVAFNNGFYSLIESDLRSIDPVTLNVSQVQLYTRNYVDPYLIPWDYHTPYAAVLTSDLDARGGPFDIYDSLTGGGVDHAQGWLIATSLNIADGAPEPAAWTLMIFGVAGIGAARRRFRAPERSAR